MPEKSNFPDRFLQKLFLNQQSNFYDRAFQKKNFLNFHCIYFSGLLTSSFIDKGGLISDYHIFLAFVQTTDLRKVSLLGVDSLWGDCKFIPADWGS